MRFALRRSARIAVLSKDHAAAVPPLAAQLRRRPEAIDEVPNGVDPERFSPGSAPDDPRALRHRATTTFVAMVCAGLDHAHEYKRVDLAIEATAALARRARRSAARRRRRSAARRAEALAAELGVADRVTFAGELGDELPDHYRAATCSCCRRSREAFGLVQIEAMACGKPVIVTSVAGRARRQRGRRARAARAAGRRRDLGARCASSPRWAPSGGRDGSGRAAARARALHVERSTDALERSLEAAGRSKARLRASGHVCPKFRLSLHFAAFRSSEETCSGVRARASSRGVRRGVESSAALWTSQPKPSLCRRPRRGRSADC